MNALKSKSIGFAFLVFGILLALLSGCAVKEESKSYSYDFTEGRCKTEKQTFSDMGSYCLGLQDNVRNKGCALSMRRADFEAKCGSKPTFMTAGQLSETPGTSSKHLKMPLENLDLPPALTATAEPKEQKLSAQSVLTVSAKPVDGIAVITTNTESELVSTLSGELLVRAIDPVTNRDALEFESATSAEITSVDLGKCMSTMDFKASGDRIKFALVGHDANANLGPTSCLVNFTNMIQNGFTVQFKNVRAVGAALETMIPTVILRVETTPDAASRNR